MVISSLIIISVLRLYQQSITFTANLRQRTSQESRVNYCLDRITNEIIDAVNSQGQLTIEPRGVKVLGGITVTQQGKNSKVARELSWTVAQDENNQYTIYRKDFSELDTSGSDLFFPVCDGIADFQVDVLNEEGLEDPNSEPAVLQISVDSYYNTSENTFTVSRTFCLRRQLYNIASKKEVLKIYNDEKAKIDNRRKR